MLSGRGIFYIKALSSVTMLGVILYAADWSAVWANLSQANPLLCLSTLIILCFIIFLSALKWQWLLSMHRVRYTLKELSSWYYIAAFFNNFLPTSIGGDGYRIYRTFDNIRSRSTAVVSVIMDRISGILTLLALGWVAAGFSSLMTGNTYSTMLFQYGSIACALLCLTMLVLYLTKSMSRIYQLRWLKPKLSPIVEHVDDYRNNIPSSLGVLLLSFAFHTLNIVALWASVNLISILPISINGVGVVEGAYVYLLGLYGVDHAQGLSFSILLRCMVIPISFAGMILYLHDKRDGKKLSASTHTT